MNAARFGLTTAAAAATALDRHTFSRSFRSSSRETEMHHHESLFRAILLLLLLLSSHSLAASALPSSLINANCLTWISSLARGKERGKREDA